jgi:PIN domain nuclease of toxin-antitoxin system
VILLDTHEWVWWVNGDPVLGAAADFLIANESAGLGVSIISCWEVAKKVEVGKLVLDRSLDAWMEGALAYPGVQLVELTPAIVIESTRLPGPFHRDPADQMIVATARILGIPLLTHDTKLVAYPHVEKALRG